MNTALKFHAILSDVDGVFRTVPFDYIHQCVVESLKPHLPQVADVTENVVADVSSSDLFVNDSDAFLEFLCLALTDPTRPLESLHQDAANTPVLFRYMDRQAKRHGRPDFLDAAQTTFNELRHGPKGQKKMKPIKPALKGLQTLLDAAMPLYLVSNAPRESIHAWMMQHGFTNLNILGADDVQLQKPHPDGLLKACHELGVRPSKAVAYCGDMPNDVAAARAASLTAVGVAYAGRTQRIRAARPDYVFTDFLEFADYATGKNVSLSMQNGIALSVTLD